MGWKDWSYKKKYTLVGTFPLILAILNLLNLFWVFIFPDNNSAELAMGTIFGMIYLIVIGIIGTIIGRIIGHFKDKRIQEDKEKNKSYWLNGEIIGLIIGIFVYLFTYTPFYTTPLFGFIFAIVSIFKVQESILGILFLWITSSVVGAIIGFIYGKIKESRRNK